ncbi:MAG TPA: hypothetical protein VGM97_21505 [Steroidobacteraceae bacterium]
MGDLDEEYALRATTASSSAAFKWYLRQVCTSAPPLLWIRLTRNAWPATLGIALLAYLAVGVAEFMVNQALAGLSGTDGAAYNPLGMVITFPVVVLIGYFAARRRRRAPLVLGAMMLINVTAMTLLSTEIMPLGYRVAYFLVGPAAALIGSTLSTPRPAR